MWLQLELQFRNDFNVFSKVWFWNNYLLTLKTYRRYLFIENSQFIGNYNKWVHFWITIFESRKSFGFWKNFFVIFIKYIGYSDFYIIFEINSFCKKYEEPDKIWIFILLEFEVVVLFKGKLERPVIFSVIWCTNISKLFATTIFNN